MYVLLDSASYIAILCVFVYCWKKSEEKNQIKKMKEFICWGQQNITLPPWGIFLISKVVELF